MQEAAPAKQAPAKQAPATPPASASTSALASALAAKVLPKAAVVHTIAECPKPQGRFEALVSTVDSNTIYVLPIAQRDALARVSEPFGGPMFSRDSKVAEILCFVTR